MTESQGTLVLHVPILPSSPSQGEGRTRNAPPTQEQRLDVTNHGDSLFHVDIHMIKCVHGTWSETDDTKASLIVFECEFNCLEDKVVKRVKVEWEFVNDPAAAAPANPTIAARGPHILRLYNSSEVAVHDEYGFEGVLEAEAPVIKPSLNGHWSRGKDYKNRFFGEARSGVRHASDTDHRYTKAFWIYSQNKQRADGIPAAFRIALVLKRENNAPFRGIFTLADFDGGWKHKLATAWKEFVGITLPNVDDPIHFNPTLPPIGGEDVDASSLGHLVTGEGLDRKYATIWGVDFGL